MPLPLYVFFEAGGVRYTYENAVSARADADGTCRAPGLYELLARQCAHVTSSWQLYFAYTAADGPWKTQLRLMRRVFPLLRISAVSIACMRSSNRAPRVRRRNNQWADIADTLRVLFAPNMYVQTLCVHVRDFCTRETAYDLVSALFYHGVCVGNGMLRDFSFLRNIALTDAVFEFDDGFRDVGFTIAPLAWRTLVDPLLLPLRDAPFDARICQAIAAGLTARPWEFFYLSFASPELLYALQSSPSKITTRRFCWRNHLSAAAQTMCCSDVFDMSAVELYHETAPEAEEAPSKKNSKKNHSLSLLQFMNRYGASMLTNIVHVVLGNGRDGNDSNSNMAAVGPANAKVPWYDDSMARLARRMTECFFLDSVINSTSGADADDGADADADADALCMRSNEQYEDAIHFCFPKPWVISDFDECETTASVSVSDSVSVSAAQQQQADAAAKRAGDVGDTSGAFGALRREHYVVECTNGRACVSRADVLGLPVLASCFSSRQDGEDDESIEHGQEGKEDIVALPMTTAVLRTVILLAKCKDGKEQARIFGRFFYTNRRQLLFILRGMTFLGVALHESVARETQLCWCVVTGAMQRTTSADAQ